MTDAAIRPAEAPESLPAHPLDPAGPEEFLAGRRILAAAGLLTEPVRFAYYGLEEPPKDDVLAYPADGPPDRRLRAFLIDVVTGESSDVVVSVTQDKVISSRTLDPLADGQVPILDQDFVLAEEIVHADPGWCAAMARRGLTDVGVIRACPLTAGSYGVADEQSRRMVRVLAFVQAREHDLAWAHPVDGVAAYVDLIERRVFRLIDETDPPVPQESGDYDDPAVRGPPRTSLRPIEITQPRDRASGWTGTGWNGRAGRYGSASTPARG
jgi:primary-amine oxidase